MMQKSVRKQDQRRAQAKAWVFFMPVVMLVSVQMSLLAATQEQSATIEEMSSEEKKDMVKEFLKEGDRLKDQKDYNLANAAYESVFLLEPENVEASKRIDRLKKIMVKEGVSETQLVTHVYDEEIGIRVKQYLNQSKEFIKRGKFAQARFTLQKLLLIDPLHKEGSKLYEEVNQKIQKKAA